MKYLYPLLGFLAIMPCISLAQDPIAITSCKALNDITDLTADYYISLDVGDKVLDCNGFDFKPIPGVFTGTLNGHGHMISKLNIDVRAAEDCTENCYANKNVGIFEELGAGAIIENIKFEEARVQTEDNANRGLIAGIARDAIIRKIVANDLRVKGPEYVDGTPGSTGGIVAIADNTQLSEIHLYVKDNALSVEIRKNAYAGGIVGIAYPGTRIEKSSIEDLYSGGADCHNGGNTDDAEGRNCAFGGLIGFITESPEKNNSDLVTISESSALGTIDTKHNVGGLVGLIDPNVSVTISNSYSRVTLVNTNEYAGGLIGRKKGTDPIILEWVYAAGHVAYLKGKGIIGDGGDSVVLGGGASYFDRENVEKSESGDNVTIDKKTNWMKDGKNFKNDGWNTQIWCLQKDKQQALRSNPNQPNNCL